MPTFKIIATVNKVGTKAIVTIDAASEAEALALVKAKGLFNAKVAEIQTPPPPPSASACEDPPWKGKYVYQMVQMPPTIELKEPTSMRTIAATYLEKVVNENAKLGWEFYRVDPIGVRESPGCLWSLLGAPAQDKIYYVLTFRREME
jgi:hypothetical protein